MKWFHRLALWFKPTRIARIGDRLESSRRESRPLAMSPTEQAPHSRRALRKIP